MNDAFQKLVDSLPVPGVDEKPPMVEISDRDRALAAEDRMVSNALLDPKRDTEDRVKYVLRSLCGMELKKDGDWKVSASGQEFWSKKVADFVGHSPNPDPGGKNLHTYVEVKGISPGKTFAFSRLDKRNNSRQPSQFEKLQEAWEHGNLVYLALGWWVARSGAKHTVIEKGKRKHTKWYRDTLDLEIALIPWHWWVDHVNGTKRRSITYSILGDKFQDCIIFKANNRWQFTPGHWWNYDGVQGGGCERES